MKQTFGGKLDDMVDDLLYNINPENWRDRTQQLACVILIILGMLITFYGVHYYEQQEINPNDYKKLTNWTQEYNNPKCIQDALDDDKVTVEEFNYISKKIKQLNIKNETEKQKQILKEAAKEYQGIQLEQTTTKD